MNITNIFQYNDWERNLIYYLLLRRELFDQLGLAICLVRTFYKNVDAYVTFLLMIYEALYLVAFLLK